MPWRIISWNDTLWHVAPAAERAPNAAAWRLVLSFRAAGEGVARSVWAPFPLEATSKAALFIQAERLRDGELAQALSARLT